MPIAPTYADVVTAHALIMQHLPRTPLIHSPMFSRLSGADVWLKCECFAAIGAFKARGALAGVHKLSAAQRAQGLICASTGNHGAAMAWAAGKMGARCKVVVPTDTPEIKLNNMRNAGASVVIEGSDWGDSCQIARGIAAHEALVYLEDGEDPWIMAGAGTVALEVMQELPAIDALLIPVGGGNLIAGCAIAAKCGEPGAPAMIGVQSDEAPGVTESMRLRKIVHRPTTTRAGGIATTSPVPMAFEIMLQHVRDMLLVSEHEILQAIAQLVRVHGILVEGAGAAPLAALLRHRAQFQGKTVALVLSGRNLDEATLLSALLQ